jgi:hypothetical protein
MFKTHRTYDLTTGVKNNSIAVMGDAAGNTKVMYHKTIVFTYVADTQEIILNNGGWDTVSTRAVINRALEEIGHHARLFRKKGETRIGDSTYSEPFTGFSRFNLKAAA